MNSYQYDLVVVGASFAGLACARAAVMGGLRVAVIEKKSSSGAKLHTTGIIVKDAIDEVEWLREVPPALVRKVEGVRLYSPNLRHVDLYAKGYYFWATDTPALLDWMCDSARSSGVDFVGGTLFENAQRHGDGWVLSVKSASSQVQRAIRTKYLVGADGPHSRVAKALGLSANEQFLYGVEHEYVDAVMEANLLHCFIDKRLAPGYIGWAVAGVGVNQIGLARRLGKTSGGEETSHQRMTAFLGKISPFVQVNAAKPVAIRAGMIPCGGVLRHVSTARAMLVGDAAGMVSPVTAGGIHTALEHGAAVGAAVASFIRDNSKTCTDPADPVNGLARHYPAFRLKRTLRWMFDHFQADWIFNMALDTAPMRQFAKVVYFHKRKS